MKKLLSSLLAIVIIACNALPAFAAEKDFVPSVTNKDAPSFVVIDKEKQEDGTEKNVIGYVKDETESVISTEYEECLIVTSLEEAMDEETEVDEEIRSLLVGIYNDLLKEDIVLSQISDELNKLVAERFGEGKNADMLVIKDVFDVQVYCEDLKEYLPPEGTTIDLTFDIDIPVDGFVAVLTYKNDQWNLVEKVVNNNENDNPDDDGTITATFENFCPVIILVPGVEETSSSFPLWTLLGIPVVGCGAWFFSKRKKDKKEA